MKSISAVINARTQSTRIPNKLMKPFAGSSLIEIALEKLNRMDFFDNRYLAVAEEELKALVPNYENVRLLERDSNAVLKGVNPQNVTFAHYLRQPSDYIFMFNPCLPFVTVEAIKDAFDYFQSADHPSYTSVIPTTEWYFNDQSQPITQTDPTLTDASRGTPFYKCVHAFHIINKEFYRQHGYYWSFQPNDPHCIEIPMDVSIDIDTEIEFNFAEFLYKKHIGMKQ